jgi:repressor LexA
MSEGLARLTERQGEVLAWIERFQVRERMPPTVREIGEAFGMRSTGSVRTHLEALRRKGRLLPSKGRRHRGLRPRNSVRMQDEVRTVPILGRIAAGPMLLAEENLEGQLLLGEGLLPRSGDVFALRVQGESMIEAGILDGDLVLVRRQPMVEPGEIAAVMVEGEATVKYFRPEGRLLRLEPANARMRPIFLDPSSGRVSILGKVVGVVRQY